MKDRVTKKEQLFKRGIIPNANDSLCLVCAILCESLDQLLISCVSSKLAWSKVSIWVGIPIGIAETMVGHLLWLKNATCGKVFPNRRSLL